MPIIYPHQQIDRNAEPKPEQKYSNKSWVWGSYRIHVKTCKIGLKRAFYRLIFRPNNQKIGRLDISKY